MGGDRRRGLVAAAAALCLAAVLAGCTLGHDDAELADAEVAAERWWSTGVDESGSRIDRDDADTASRRISSDVDLYCGALADTLAQGDSLLPADVEPDDAGYVRVQRTFFAELAALAPDEVADSWRSVGAVMQALVDMAGGADDVVDPDLTGLPPAEEALVTIERHALDICHLGEAP